MSWMNTLGSGLMDFAGSGLGQAVIGAGLGYGADKLMGGEGKTGALLGGLAGGFNAYGSDAGFMDGGNFDQSYLGGLFKPTTTQVGGLSAKQARINDLMLSNEGLTLGGAEKAYAGEQLAAQATAPQQLGLFDQARGFYDTNKDLLGGGSDIMKAYGDYQSGQSERDMNQAQMSYIQSLQAQQEADNARRRQSLATTQAGANTGFSNSSLASYYGV